MIRGKWMWFWLVAAPFVAGCSGFWNPPASSGSGSGNGGCTTNCTTASSGLFYILNASITPQVVGEVISSGKLAAITGGTVNLVSAPYAMALDGSSFLYVSTTAGIFGYPISSSGALGKPENVSADITAVAIAVDGNWLVEAVQGSGVVTFNAVPLNPTTGNDNGSIQTAPFSVTRNNPAVQKTEMAVSSDGKNIFVALGSGGAVAFPFFPTTAANANPFGASGTVVNVINSNSQALSVAVDPNLNLFYVGETNADSTGKSGAILAYLYSSIGGTPTLATSAAVASGGLAPNFILPASAGAELFVANGQGTNAAGNIASFSVAGSNTTWTLTAGPTIAAGTQPFSLAIDSTSTFLLATNSLGTPELSTYTFGATAGSLTAQITANTGTAPEQILALP